MRTSDDIAAAAAAADDDDDDDDDGNKTILSLSLTSEFTSKRKKSQAASCRCDAVGKLMGLSRQTRFGWASGRTP